MGIAPSFSIPEGLVTLTVGSRTPVQSDHGPPGSTQSPDRRPLPLPAFLLVFSGVGWEVSLQGLCSYSVSANAF